MVGCADAGSPASLSGLLNAIAEEYELTFYFGFGANADQARTNNADAKNLLNFSFDGSAELTSGKTVVGKYTIDVDIDLDIFPLIPALLDCVTLNEAGNMPAGFEVTEEKLDNLIEAIKDMGYISIVVDEYTVTAEGEEGGSAAEGEFYNNIITIYSDFSDGFAYIGLNTHLGLALSSTPIDTYLNVGGMMEFEGLAGQIASLITGSASAAAEGDSVLDTIMDVVNQLLTYMPQIDTGDLEGSLADIAANGFTLNIDQAIKEFVNPLVTDLLGAGTASMLDLSYLYKGEQGAKTLTVSLTTPVYGACEEVEFTDLSAVKYLGTTEDQTSGVTVFYDELNNMRDSAGNALPTNVQQDSILPQVGDKVTVNGLNLVTGERENYAEMVVIGIEGYNPMTAGEQTVTYYLTDSKHRLYSTFSLLESIAGVSLPRFLAGVHTVEITVNVPAYDETKDVTWDGITADKEQEIVISAGSDWFAKLGSNITAAIDGVTYTLSAADATIMSNGKDVTADVLANGMSAGTYTISLHLGFYEQGDEFTFKVDDAYVVRTDSDDAPAGIVNGQAWTFPQYEVHSVGFDGVDKVVENATVEYIGKTPASLGGLIPGREETVSLEDVFTITDGTYVWNSTKYESFIIRYTVELESGTKTIDITVSVSK